MKKSIIIAIIITLISYSLLAQDKITRLNGSEINCSIITIDSLKITFKYENKGQEINTLINMSEVYSYTYLGNDVVIQPVKKPTELKQSQSISNLNKPIKAYADSIENKHQNFAILYSNEVIGAKDIEYLEPIFSNPMVMVDTRKFSPNQIKFYKNETGFYANIQDFGINRKNYFSERIIKGKLNLYEQISYNYSPGYINPATGLMSGGFVTRKSALFYNTGFSGLEKANYKNLSEVMADNIKAIEILSQYKKATNAQIVLSIIGGVSFITGAVTYSNKMSKWDGESEATIPNTNASIAGMLIGGGCFVATYAISFSKPRLIKEAVRAYNQ